jgi:hypothetical protein
MMCNVNLEVARVLSTASEPTSISTVGAVDQIAVNFNRMSVGAQSLSTPVTIRYSPAVGIFSVLQL